MGSLTSLTRDIMGDMSFSGGFETLASGRDTEGWMEMVTKDLSLTSHSFTRCPQLQTGIVFVTGNISWLSPGLNF